jgi:hypothetical protein
VAELEATVEPRVHVRDAFAISLWTYYEPVESPIAPALGGTASSRCTASRIRATCSIRSEGLSCRPRYVLPRADRV